MKEYGFIRLASYVPEIKLGDVDFNVIRIIDGIRRAQKEKIDILVFPELCVTGYTLGDLFHQSVLLKKTEEGISHIAEASRNAHTFIVVGAPFFYKDRLYNCAFVIAEGEIKAIVPKINIPNYGEFYEKRWFVSGKGIEGVSVKYGGQSVLFSAQIVFDYKNVKIGVEICEDLWVPSPPSSKLVEEGAEVILNLSASNTVAGKKDYVKDLVRLQSARCRCAYAYSSAGAGESTSDLVFSGLALIGVNGRIYEETSRFGNDSLWLSKDVDIEQLRLDRIKYHTLFEVGHYGISERDKGYFLLDCNKNNDLSSYPLSDINKEECDDIIPQIEKLPFVPGDLHNLSKRCEEIVNIQVNGLMTRLRSINCRKAVIGISGGLDSTLALLVTARAFKESGYDSHGILGITMPGQATSSRTLNNAIRLMELLRVQSLQIPIAEAVAVHFRDIGQDPTLYDVTYENSQARERTQILMDIANKESAIVIGTGDMSEMALGWCTYNGDQMSMYNVNAGVPKTLVRHLVRWFAEEAGEELHDILLDIIDTPISPELVPSETKEITQKTEDLVGPYELHDFFLYNFLRNSFSPKKIYWLACKAFKGEYCQVEILKWLKVFVRRFFNQQFKRNPMPDGPKVGTVSLSPRGDWRMPSDASANLWLNELDEIKIIEKP